MKSLIDNRSLIENAAEPSYQPAPSKAFTEIIGKNPVKKRLLVLGDIGILYFSLYLSFAIRGSEVPMAQVWQVSLMPFTILFYNWDGITRFEQMKAKPVVDAMATAYQPVLLSWELWTTPNLYAGREINLSAHVVNDAEDDHEEGAE